MQIGIRYVKWKIGPLFQFAAWNIAAERDGSGAGQKYGERERSGERVWKNWLERERSGRSRSGERECQKWVWATSGNSAAPAPLTCSACDMLTVIKPHRSRATYVDAAYCYRRSSVVSLSVCHDREPCKNRWTNRDAVWGVDLVGPRNHYWMGSISPRQGAIMRGKVVAH